MAFTHAEAKAYLKDRNFDDSSARGVRQMLRISNQARQALARRALWSFDKAVSQEILDAAHTTGTVSVSAGATTVTGVGTGWTTGNRPSGEIGKYIRFNGEPMQYRITAVAGATSLTIERAYEGASNLSGVTYEITDEEFAAPTRLRSVEEILQDLSGHWLRPIDADALNAQRLFVRSTGVPQQWAFEWRTVSSYKTLYLRVNPAPSERRILTISGYYWPAEITADADVFGLPDLSEARTVMEAYLDAFRLDEQGLKAEYQAQLAIAEETARRSLGSFQVRRNGGQREMYSSRFVGVQSYQPRIVDVS